MTKKQKINKYFRQQNKLTLKNQKYRRQVAILTDFLIKEDLAGKGDITTKKLIKKNQTVRGQITARQIGIIAGIEEVIWLLQKHRIKSQFRKKDGQKVKKGDKILEFTGSIKDILKLERTILNILQRLSGIATETNKLVKKNGPLIVPTRKTQWGVLDKKAVALGKGGTHRLGLYDFILIKDNHIKFTNSHLETKLQALKNTFWEIEVENKKQALWASCFKPGAIMFDNMTAKQIKKTIKLLSAKNIIYEASGGITKKNIQQYYNSGVDIISLGALTHSSQALNISLEIL